MVQEGDKLECNGHVYVVTDKIERFIDKDGDWHLAFISYSETAPRGEQWRAEHGKESDYERSQDH